MKGPLAESPVQAGGSRLIETYKLSPYFVLVEQAPL